MCHTAEAVSLVDAEAVQPEYHAFMAQQEFIRAKSGFDLHSVSCKRSLTGAGNSPVLSFGKVGENWKKAWRKYGENMWKFSVLPSFFEVVLKLKVSLECNIFLTCASYAFQI